MPFTNINNFRTHLAAGTKTLTVCLRVVRKDGEVFGFTRHTSDIVLPAMTVGSITVPETTYYALPGCVPTDLQETASLAADNFEISGPVGDYVTDADIRGGRFRGADWTLIFCNYENTGQQMLRKRGKIANATVSGLRFTLACKSLLAALETEIIDVTSPLCRYKRLGYGGCGFDIEGVTTDNLPARVLAVVESVTSQREIVLADAAEDVDGNPVAISDYPVGRFNKGLIWWAEGLNAGLDPMDIQEHRADNVIETKWRMPFPIAEGDEVTLDVGCDRRFATCGADGLFDVAWSFGGEPDSPTIEQVSAAHL